MQFPTCFHFLGSVDLGPFTLPITSRSRSRASAPDLRVPNSQTMRCSASSSGCMSTTNGVVDVADDERSARDRGPFSVADGPRGNGDAEPWMRHVRGIRVPPRSRHRNPVFQFHVSLALVVLRGCRSSTGRIEGSDPPTGSVPPSGHGPKVTIPRCPSSSNAPWFPVQSASRFKASARNLSRDWELTKPFFAACHSGFGLPPAIPGRTGHGGIRVQHVRHWDR